MQLKRGCPYECVYCTYPLLEGRQFLQQDVTTVVDEMHRCYETAGVDQFFIVDSVFNAIPALANATVRKKARRLINRRMSSCCCVSILFLLLCRK